MNKSQIRKHLKSKRYNLSFSEVQTNSQIICQYITDQYLIDASLHIGLYLPFGHEVDLRTLLTCKVSCYIPSVEGNNMQFQQWAQKLNITHHSLGMQQPNFINGMPKVKLDICFMPLLGFDNNGHRLGMGGGFYDRYFEHNENNTLLVGVAHDCQQLTKLPHDNWDVKLDAIITESQHITINSKHRHI